MFITIVFAIFYFYSVIEEAATKKVNNKMGKLMYKYHETVRDYNLAQLAKKYKNRSLRK